MRIALIARGCRPGAGIELYTYELAKRLAERHDVHLFTDPRETLSCGATLRPIKVAGRPLWHSILHFSTKAGFEVQTGNFDIVHTQGSDGAWGDVVTAHSCHWAGMRASLKLNPGFVNRVRKCLSPAHRAITTLERTTFLSAKHLVSVSRRVARQVKAAYPGIQRIPLSVIYPGVDSRFFNPDGLTARRSLLRSELGLKDTDVLFTLLANSPRLKGAERLLRALAQAQSRAGHLMIASPRGGNRFLERLAGKLNIRERVHFFSVGPDVLSVYAAGDVHAALPEYESFGLTLLEAMACGRPLLITRNAGAAELMHHEKEAILLPALASTDTVAAAMDRLVEDPGGRQRMALASRETAEHYSWDRMVASLEEIYLQVVEEKKKK
jgi:glycosyltransferase involved in cell wall biosynthesis